MKATPTRPTRAVVGAASAHVRPNGDINLIVLPAIGGVYGSTLTPDEARAVIAALSQVL